MYAIHVVGKAKDIVDIPSRSFRLGHRWNFSSNAEFLFHFNQRFPLPQGIKWQLFEVSPKIISRVISKFLMLPLKMDV